MLEGCSKLRRTKDLRAPITFNNLKIICDQLPGICYSAYESILFRAAYMLAYFGLFRVSELVFTSKEQSDKPLKATDVAFQNNSTLIRVIIRHSKTKQSGPPDILLIPCEKNAEWCPVCCLRQNCQIRPACDGCLFIHKDRSPLKRV